MLTTRHRLVLLGAVIGGAAAASCLLPTYDVTPSSASSAGGSAASSSRSTGNTSTSSTGSTSIAGSGGGSGGGLQPDVELVASGTQPHSIAVVGTIAYWVEGMGTVMWVDTSNGTLPKALDLTPAKKDICAIDAIQAAATQLVTHGYSGEVFAVTDPVGNKTIQQLQQGKSTMFPDWDSCRIVFVANENHVFWFNSMSPDWELVRSRFDIPLVDSFLIEVMLPGTLYGGNKDYIGYSDVGAFSPAPKVAVRPKGNVVTEMASGVVSRGICTPGPSEDVFYFTEPSAGVFQWSPDAGLDNASPFVLGTVQSPQQAACDENNVYWTEYDSPQSTEGRVVGYSIKGGHYVLQIPHQEYPCSIAISGGYVYWTTCGMMGQVRRALVP